MDNVIKPKVFISYSWSSPEYQERIIKIVDALRESGIETVFDKYNLKEGADLNVFMEKIVNDPSITKVLIFCDKQYTEKANNRKGGAGTETLIISPEVYNDADPAGENKKFIPIIMEKNIETGKPYVPTYMASRKYFDFTKQDFYGEFEKLVRFLYGQPEYREPALGQIPSYVTDFKQPYLGTTTRKELAINTLKEGKTSALRYCEDFFSKVYETLDGFIIDTDKEKFDEVDEIVWNHINDLLPLSIDCIDVLETMIVCEKNEPTVNCIRSFLEKLLIYRVKAKGNRQTDFQSDHFHFFAYYVYINLVKFLITKYDFELLKQFLHNYYVRNRYNGSQLQSFSAFYPNTRIFELRKSKLQLNRRSLLADLLKQGCKDDEIEMDNIMQADLLLKMYAFKEENKERIFWYPVSLVYAGIREQPFELFVRAESKEFFNKTLSVLGFSHENLENIKKQLSEFGRNAYHLGWIEPLQLSNIDNLATKD